MTITIIYSLIIFCLIIFVYVRHHKRRIQRDLEILRHKPRPSWLSKISNDITDKKLSEDITTNHVFVMTACNWVLPNCKSKELTWKQFEIKCQNALEKIKDIDFNIIIGIKSGGAVAADYIGYYLHLPVDYLKIHKYGSKPLHQRMYEFGQKYNYNTSVSGDVNVTNKKVLLVDDSCFTGSTMKIAKEYLMKQKPKKLTAICIFGPAYSGNDAIVGNYEAYRPLPWSYDP